MTIIRKSLVSVIICSLAAICICCTTQAPEPTRNTIDNQPPIVASVEAESVVTLAVTSNFGKEMMFEGDIEIGSGTSAMTALQDAVEVETKYGGGFVNSINGISSAFEGSNSQKKDWFFFINGLSFSIGAADYVVHPGDIEQWDFRDWSYYQMVPAIVGDFPQPFLSGSRGTVYPTKVIYEQGLETEADSLVHTLKQAGVNDIASIDITRLTEQIKSNNNLILVCRSDNTLIAELSKVQKKLGLYAHVNNGALTITDAAGKSQALNTDSGVIQATQNPWNPRGSAAGENTLWIITGTSDKSIKNAVAVINSRPAELKYAFAVIVTDTDIFRIP